RKSLWQRRNLRPRRILLPDPRIIFFRNPWNGIDRQAQAHRGISGNQPESIVIAQEPRAGHPAGFTAIRATLDRQRVTNRFPESLLEDAGDAIAFQFVFEV